MKLDGAEIKLDRAELRAGAMVIFAITIGQQSI